MAEIFGKVPQSEMDNGEYDNKPSPEVPGKIDNDGQDDSLKEDYLDKWEKGPRDPKGQPDQD